ncbi:hypothetical protein HELRODRAFT_162579 [Helobdella robusta]|uniref:Fork-head domain-containing protein n=1 Tax=Helobdella robusta TaxID=6412 RepID=T1ESV3_HELRO|nr:hypothetical protein HELRODRAFT_162579 [Helobdella robusta]ESN99091.1 hypothetical protein HELRODRAFT_162579 [Helobdella robusta]
MSLAASNQETNNKTAKNGERKIKELLIEALTKEPNGLTVSQLYNYIVANSKTFTLKDITWQGNVRHLLSKKSYFRKTDVKNATQRGRYWVFDVNIYNQLRTENKDNLLALSLPKELDVTSTTQRLSALCDDSESNFCTSSNNFLCSSTAQNTQRQSNQFSVGSPQMYGYTSTFSNDPTANQNIYSTAYQQHQSNYNAVGQYNSYRSNFSNNGFFVSGNDDNDQTAKKISDQNNQFAYATKNSFNQPGGTYLFNQMNSVEPTQICNVHNNFSGFRHTIANAGFNQNGYNQPTDNNLQTSNKKSKTLCSSVLSLSKSEITFIFSSSSF